MTTLTVHAECGKTWKQRGNRTGHCSGCHLTFEGITLFDLHRRGGVCADPEQMLVGGKPLIFDPTHGDGTWRSDTSELKAAYERLESAGGTPGAGDTFEAANRQNVTQRVAPQTLVVERENGAQVLPHVFDTRATVSTWDAASCISADLRAKSAAHRELAGRLQVTS